ncbi:MAG: phosphoenolpyruvate--protein phosphotransferase [Actinobacteria bacterium]|uniref:Phosphoenolpyruvate-protein phosphotransferase n=1 Tax=freshwater metagenome TaxID=449393 RepID=A0A6J7VWL6_9ZZZZ|nr:phosphoenolpyruvate--protein phosphotransferase [Actinomycetota bacterium]
MKRRNINSKIIGIGIGRGIAIGPVIRMPEPIEDPQDLRRSASVGDEIARVEKSVDATAIELVRRGALVGGETENVLVAESLIVGDPTVLEDIRSLIQAGKTAERAVFEAFRNFQTKLLSLGGYMAERAADLDDVAHRVIAHLIGVPAPGIPHSDSPFILIANDLAPADTAMLDLSKILALVTSGGGPTAHTAILARSKGLIAIVGAHGAEKIATGAHVIVDAAHSCIYLIPTDVQLHDARQRQLKESDAVAPLTPGALLDGTLIPLLANLGSLDEIDSAVALGAEGVGLFRTEFLFLDKKEAPSFHSQREDYRRLLAAFPGKKVVVRTLDAGADKPLAFLQQDNEGNPALGMRGLRAMRRAEPIMREQLRALAEADKDTDAQLWVMAPMVADAAETTYFMEIAKEYGLNFVGVMAEIPSSALLAEQILGEADFVSIGTNDLTQYTLAADRELNTTASYQNPWHPAVLRLIKMLGDAGSKSGKPVGVCGEAASDPLLAVVLVGLGATTLSMAPAALVDVRAELAKYSLADAQRLAMLALAENSASQAREVVAKNGLN